MRTDKMVREGRQTALVSRFMDELQQPRTSYISSERLAKRFGLNQSALARLAGVHRNTLRTNPASEALQKRLREMVKIVITASGLTHDIDKALYWFINEPIGDDRGQTAAELVADGRVEAVMAYLDDLANGAAG